MFEAITFWWLIPGKDANKNDGCVVTILINISEALNKMASHFWSMQLKIYIISSQNKLQQMLVPPSVILIAFDFYKF